MNTHMTHRCKVTAADFEMETTQKDRILLPYHGELWGDLLYEIKDAALPFFGDECERGLLYDEVVRDENVSILFNVQRKQVRATAYITAQTTRDEQFMVRIPTPMEPSEISDVLDCFLLANDGAGLTLAYRNYYRDTYIGWRSGTS